MVVDDEEDILRVMRAGLTRYGHKVMTFSDPMLAMKELELHHADYKLVLTDIRMPSLSGIELAKNARVIDSDVKIMIMTAFELTAFELSHDLSFARIEEVLRKPISLSRLCRAIDNKRHE